MTALSPGECLFLCGGAIGFCGAFLLLGVAWSMVDAVRAFREGSES